MTKREKMKVGLNEQGYLQTYNFYGIMNCAKYHRLVSDCNKNNNTSWVFFGRKTCKRTIRCSLCEETQKIPIQLA